MNSPKKLFQKSRPKPTDAQVRALLDASAELAPEFIPQIHFARKAGIPMYVTRHLEMAAINGKEVTFSGLHAHHPRVRVVPDDLVATLNRSNKYLCPHHHTMTDKEYQHAWERVVKMSKTKVVAAALTWDYEDSHTEEENLEHIISYLDRFATKWLTPEERKELLYDHVEGWKRLPPKRKPRKWRTRAEILGKSR